jgi:hypothetical protein
MIARAFAFACPLFLVLSSPLAAQTSNQPAAQAGESNLSSNAAPAVAAAQAGPNQVKLIPAQGPVDEEVRIVGSGLPPNQPISISGGADPGQLTPIAQANVDTSGAFRAIVKMTAQVKEGGDYYFVLKVGDRTLQPLAYHVASRQPAPASD